jgi:two-component system response regulator RegA
VNAASLLLVDDDAVFRERAAKALRDRGFEVRTAADVPSGIQLAEQDPPELAVVDLRMPGPDGLTMVDALLRIDPHTRVVVLTGYGSVATAVDAMRRGAAHYLQKPVLVEELVTALRGGDAPAAKARAVPSLARHEWEYIHRVLDECAGNVSEAARQLGIHRRSLQRKLQKNPPRR